MEPSPWCKLLFLTREIVEWGCFASGEAETKKGTTAMIVASEKCILERRAEDLVTVELLVCNK
jgi:hypothetical protein